MIPFGRFGPFINNLKGATVNSPGNLDSDIRNGIVNYALQRTIGESNPEKEFPDAINEFLEKLIFNPKSINDTDISDLIRADFNEDEILEIINCGSLGSGLGRYKIIHDLLRE